MSPALFSRARSASFAFTPSFNRRLIRPGDDVQLVPPRGSVTRALRVAACGQLLPRAE